MWNNPRLLDVISNALFVLAALIAAGYAVHALVHSPAFPLRTLRVTGDLAHVKGAEIIEALQGRVSGTFFTVDLEGLRAVFEALPWVRRAEVRRLWPDRLEVRLEEHVPLAHWGKHGSGRLVNVHGEVFSAAMDTPLPVFSGPEGTAQEVMKRYSAFRVTLVPLGLEPSHVLLSDRGSWELRLSNGLVVQLGRERPKDPLLSRLERFVEAYPVTLGAMDRQLTHVDLRYPNGFALRVPGLRAEKGAAARGTARRGASADRPPA